MFPGGRMDPRKLGAMMKQLGIDVKEVPDVERVVITTPTKEYVFSKAEVTIMKAQGQTTYQVVGNPQVVDRATGSVAITPGAGKLPPATSPPASVATPQINEDDVKLVMEQAKVPREKAMKALTESDGEPAAAIVKLMEGG